MAHDLLKQDISLSIQLGERPRMKWLTYNDKTAIISGSNHIHYRAFFSAIDDVAQRLRARFSPGERVAIVAANSPEWISALYGTWQAGMTVVPIDFMSTAAEIAYILDDCAPVAVWTDEGSQEKVKEAMGLQANARPALLSLADLRFAEDPEDRLVDMDGIGESPDEALALIVYTSGTTGNPKGVMLTFGNLRANTEACSVKIQVFIPDDRVLVVLPLHHAYPLMGSVVMPMSIGATAVFAQAMSGPAILEALQNGKCTFIIGVPRLLELFRDSIMAKIRASFLARCLLRLSAACHSLRFSRLLFAKVQKTFGGCIRYISCGGAATDPQVTRDFYALGLQVLEGYGMTETAPMISFTPPDRHKPGSPGKPIGCNELKIENGEVCVRGANVMKGYYNRPEETAQVIDADGWLHTGDLGYVDKDGFLFLTGRSKELLILGNGKNIDPNELERKLMEKANGLLAECAVGDDGRRLVAVMVPDADALAARGILNIRQTLIDQILEPYNESVPSYKRVPSLVVRSTPLPRTRLGKLRRHVLKEELLHADGQEDTAVRSSEPAPDSALYRTLAKALEELSGRAVGPDEHFELDLGLDSLAKLNLLSVLYKEHHLSLAPEALAQFPTARALCRAIEEKAVQTDAGPEQETSADEIPLPRPSWSHGLLHLLFKALPRCFSRVKATGAEHIPTGACVFAPNHQSVLDGLYLGGLLSGKRFRETYFYTISKFIDGSFTSRFARRHNLVAMELNGDLRTSLTLLERALKEGKSVVIFPEGTRSMDGSLSEFHPTFARLALAAGVPIVPVAIDGAIKVLPRGRRLPSFGTVKVTVLPPITPAQGDTPESLRDRTVRAISECLPAASRQA